MQLLTPTVVDVLGTDGRLRPALLLASRGDRRFVQVSHAPGDNRLRWVAVDALVDGEVRARTPQPLATGSTGAVALSPPRAQR